MLKSLLFFLCSTLHAATLTVGTNAEFPPFTYIESGQFVGFDIDIAKEVAKRLNHDIAWKDMPFDALIPEIVLGHVDFVAAGISYTEERSKRVLFTKSYLSGDPLVIFSKEPLALSDLPGKTVVVVEGFTADLFLSEQTGITPLRLPTQADAFLAVKNGRADAFVTAKTTADAFSLQHKGGPFYATPLPGTGETCALVIPKSKPELLLSIQAALDAMEADGTMDKLKKQWNLR